MRKMLKGIDVSYWQGDIDFEVAKKENVSFAYIRAQFGTHIDTMFSKNWTKSKECGILRGAYFFPIVEIDIAEQTRLFIDSIKNMNMDLPPAIDVEKFSGKIISAKQVKEIAEKIYDAIGINPVIYTSESMWNECGGKKESYFERNPLWLASWNTAVDKLSIPEPWLTWSFWQSNVISNGSHYGTSPWNTVDLDYFNGNEATLKSLIERAKL